MSNERSDFDLKVLGVKKGVLFVEVSDRDHDFIHARVSEEYGEFLLGLVCLHHVVIVRGYISSVVIHEITVVVRMHRCVQLLWEFSIRGNCASHLVRVE